MTAMCQLCGTSSGVAWTMTWWIISAADRSKVWVKVSSVREVTSSKRNPHVRSS
jgi:hypothetical protein